MISIYISFEIGLIYAMRSNDQALMVLNKMHIILLFNVVLSTMAFSIMGEGNNETNVCMHIALCTILTILLTFLGKSCNAHMIHASGVYNNYMASRTNFEHKKVIRKFWHQDNCF